MKKLLTTACFVTLCSCAGSANESSLTEARPSEKDQNQITYSEFATCVGSSSQGSLDVSLLSMDEDSKQGLIKVTYFPLVQFPDEGGMDSQPITDYSTASLEVVQEALVVGGNKFQINMAMVDDDTKYQTKVMISGKQVASKLTCKLK